MTYIKKHIPELIALTGAVFITAFFIWAFNQHGTIGLFRVNGFFKMVFIIIGIFGLVLFILGLSYLWVKTRKNTRGLRWLSVFIIILSLPAIIIPPAAFSYLSGIFSTDFLDTPPQLLLTADIGEYGIPDMAVYFTTEGVTYDNKFVWGETGDNNTLTQEEGSQQHLFIMNNLKPDTHYHYQINDGQIVDFSTPPIDGQLHFAMASDAHFASENSRSDLTAAMLSGIASSDNEFDMFFFIGDLVEYGFLDNQWEEAFNAINTVTANIPVRYAAGNHDTIFSGLNNYLNYCVPQGLDSNAESRLWSRIDIGTVHFLVLDVEWSAETYTRAQADWLEEQLKDIPEDDWTIVLCHGFYYASGIYYYGWQWYDNQETINAITPLFEEYHVDLICSGHVHNMEMLEENGVKYAVCGAFGGVPDPERTYTSPSSIWYAYGQYAFLDVVLDGDQCTLTFRNQDFEDLYTITFDNNS